MICAPQTSSENPSSERVRAARRGAVILHIVTRMNVGGVASHVLLLSDALERRGYRIVLAAGVCETRKGDIPACIPPRRNRITLPALSRSISPWRDLRAIWSVYRVIRRERPRIVHTHTAKAGLVGRLAARVAGTACVVHTFHGNSLSGYFSPAANAIFRRIEQLLAHITDRICVVSNQQFEEICGRFRIGTPAKFRIVPLGLDLELEMRQPLPRLHDDVLRVGWIGRMVEVKGIPLLAGVIEEAARRNLAVQFLVAGDGPERELIRALAARVGPDRLRWLGWVSDVPTFLAECHVLIQTSRNEGTPVTLIQAMAAGRPFVSTPAGGVVDLVNGEALHREAGCRWYANGVLSSAEPAAFVSALEHFLAVPACLERMGLEARNFVAERFRGERLAEDVDRIYVELLQGEKCEF